MAKLVVNMIIGVLIVAGLFSAASVNAQRIPPATMIMIAAGFHMTWASPTLPKLLKDASVPVTADQSSWIVGLLTVGSMIGPFLVVLIVDKWGRKTALLTTSIPLLMSCILIGAAQNYWWYFIGRFIAGIGFGNVYMLLPMYLGEIAEDRIRGGIGILLSVMSNSGYLIPYCVGPWLSISELTAVGGIIPIVFILMFVWMPETPYFHIMMDRPDSARKSLEWLRGTKDVDEELEKVTRTVAIDQKNRGTLRELITEKGNRKALMILLGLFSAQQFTGNLAIINYSTVIFNEVGSDISSEVAVIITGIVQLVVSILIVFLADKAGRRTLVLLSLFFSSIFLIGMGVYFHLKSNGNDVSVIAWLPVTTMVGYLVSFMLGIGPLPMTIMSEIFPCNVKAVATTLGILYISICSTAVFLIYPTVSNAYGIHVAMYGFAFGTMLWLIIMFIYLPETRGKSLGDIQLLLRARPASQFELQDMITK